MLQERLAAPEPPKVGCTRPWPGCTARRWLRSSRRWPTWPIIRSQIERITPTPNERGTPEVQPHGDLALILELSEADERKCERPGHERPGRELSVVAGARNHLYRTFMVWARLQRRGPHYQR